MPLRQTIRNDYAPVDPIVETEFGEMRVVIHVRKDPVPIMVEQHVQHPQFLDENSEMTDTDTGTPAMRQSHLPDPSDETGVRTALYWTDENETEQTWDVTAYPVMEQIIRHETVEVQDTWEGTGNLKYSFTSTFTIQHEVLDQNGDHMHWIKVGSAELNEAEIGGLVGALGSYNARKGAEKGW